MAKNYYNSMLAALKADNGIADKQEFKIVTAESGAPVSDKRYRFNGYNLEYYNDAKGTWITSNTFKDGLYSGDWIISKEAV